MTYDEAIDFLFNLEHGSVKLGLERIAAAVEHLNHPERRYLTVHVAGTNGKGSTAAFLASILEAAGRRTGLLTSPHLLAFGERIRISGGMLPRPQIAALTTELEPLIRSTRLSYFEATTALAFEAFARAEVSAAVIEVGMGGRLDATNVLEPALTVVTGIALDHTKSLGFTHELIAAEKAGIMKPGTPHLMASGPLGVCGVFERRGAEISAPVHMLEDRVAVAQFHPQAAGTRYRFTRADDGSTQERTIRLRGTHQVANALLAEEGVRLLAAGGLAIPEPAYAAGLARADWPGRFEIVPGQGEHPLVILDVAHNASGGEAVADTYRRWMTSSPPPTLIVSMLSDKSHADFFASLRGISEHLHLLPLDSPRAAELADLQAAARAAGFAPRTFPDMAQAWDAARERRAPVVITGSFFTVKAGYDQLGIGPQANLFRRGEPSPPADTR